MGSILHNCSKGLESRAWINCGKRIPSLATPTQLPVRKGLADLRFSALGWQSMCSSVYGTSSKVLGFFALGKDFPKQFQIQRERICAYPPLSAGALSGSTFRFQCSSEG